MTVPDRRYSTGLRFLDARLDGGLPVGSLLAVTASASTESELLLYHFAASQPMQYLSTTNPAEVELRSAIEDSAVPSPVELEFVHRPPEEVLADPESTLSAIPPESFVVVDPIDGLERVGTEQYVSFLNALKRRLRETDSIGIFHGLDTEPIPDARRLTLHRADAVWRLEQLVLSREIKTRLLVTKLRRGRALSEPISLVLSDRVRIDTSRRIG